MLGLYKGVYPQPPQKNSQTEGSGFLHFRHLNFLVNVGNLTTHISETEPKKHGERCGLHLGPRGQVEVELYRDFLSLVK